MTDPTAPPVLSPLLDNLRGMCAFRDPDGRICEQVRSIPEFCTACYAAMLLDAQRAEVARLTFENEQLKANLHAPNCPDRDRQYCSYCGNYIGTLERRPDKQ
jgi:hypothetical protein